MWRCSPGGFRPVQSESEVRNEGKQAPEAKNTKNMKILCFIYCLSVSFIAIKIASSSSFSSLFTYLHILIILFQSAMIWFPKPK